MLEIDWNTYEIFIPKSYLTLVSGTLYNLDSDQFRLDLKEIEASAPGMGEPDTHRHNTTVTIVGTTFARTVEILSPYNVTFEDGQYSVVIINSNNNIWDVQGNILNQNQVQVIPTNSAGLVVTGSAVTEQDKDDIADKVWESEKDDHNNPDTFGRSVQVTEKLTKTLL